MPDPMPDPMPEVPLAQADKPRVMNNDGSLVLKVHASRDVHVGTADNRASLTAQGIKVATLERLALDRAIRAVIAAQQSLSAERVNTTLAGLATTVNDAAAVEEEVVGALANIEDLMARGNKLLADFGRGNSGDAGNGVITSVVGSACNEKVSSSLSAYARNLIPLNYRPESCEFINPPDNRRKASSVWDNRPPGQGHHKGMLDSSQGWSARNNRRGEWYQIDLGSEQEIDGVVVQGRTCCGQAVRSYKIQVSSNGQNFEQVDEGKVFDYPPTDLNDKYPQRFSTRIRTRYVRFIVQTWQNHITSRFGILKCDEETDSIYTCKVKHPQVDEPQTVNATVTPLGGTMYKLDCPLDKTKFEKIEKKCFTYNALDENRKSSTTHSNDRPGYRYGATMLDSRQAWSAASNDRNQWHWMDLGEKREITTFLLQGRGNNYQYVKCFKLSVSDDGDNWTPLSNPTTKTREGDGSWKSRCKISNQKLVFSNRGVGNYYPEEFKLPQGTFARYIRIEPLAWNRHISMRSAVKICTMEQAGAQFKDTEAQVSFFEGGNEIASIPMPDDGKVTFKGVACGTGGSNLDKRIPMNGILGWWKAEDLKVVAYENKITMAGPNGRRNLNKCYGECDRDSDCKGSLKCFQRSENEEIPGCTGGGNSRDWDYCYDPNDPKSAYEWESIVGKNGGKNKLKVDFVAGMWDVRYGFPGSSGAAIDGAVPEYAGIFGDSKRYDRLSFGNIIQGRGSLCSATAYEPLGWKGRVLNGGRSNWLHGHWAGYSKVAYLDGWKSHPHQGPPKTLGRYKHAWTVMCSTNAGTNGKELYVNEDGKPFLTSGASISSWNQYELIVGRRGRTRRPAGYSEDSSYRIGEVIAWNRGLTPAELQAATQYMIDRLAGKVQ